MITTFEEIKKLYNAPDSSNTIMEDIVPYLHKKKTKNKTINIKFGRLYVNLLLPEDFRLIDEPITKKVCKGIISDLINKYDGNTISSTIQKLNDEMFEIATTSPVSFDINSFIVPDKIAEQKDKLVENLNIGKINDIEFAKSIANLTKDLIKYFKIHSDGFSDIIESGTKVSAKDIAVFLLVKGKVTSINGIEGSITTCLNDGFELDDFFKSAAQARLAYYIRSSGTAVPGALSRVVAFGNSQTTLSSKSDCGTKRYIAVSIDENNFKLLQGRYHYSDKPKPGLVLIGKDSNIIGKTINLRSPIYCKDKTGICHTCYGELHTQLSTKYIGLITSSVINADAVGVYMGARHKTSLIDSSEVDFTVDLH